MYINKNNFMVSEKSFSKKQISKCGKIIAEWKNIDEAVTVLSKYRTLHIEPLQSIYKFLKKKVVAILPNSQKYYVSQRLKRMNAIIHKIYRYPTMNLSRMQDIWGCRAVLPNLEDVYKLKSALTWSRSIFNPPESKDYIENPKFSWYRWIHLIYKYKTKNESKIHLNWLQIEIQIRTLLQHYWSTTVETVWIFTWESLKSSQWNEEWLHFFRLASQAFSIMEDTTLQEDLSKEVKELQEQLKDYMEKLQVKDTLAWYANSLSFTNNSNKNTEFSLITLNTREKIIKQLSFTKKQRNDADNMYQYYEKLYRDDSFVQVILLSTLDIKNLKKAYPNYFAHTIEFLKNIENFLKRT